MVVSIRPQGAYRQVPLDLPLWQIMEAIARHEREAPTHGIDCVCMDDYSREIAKHIYRAVPDREYNHDTWEHQFKIRQRIKHVLAMASRQL